MEGLNVSCYTIKSGFADLVSKLRTFSNKEDLSDEFLNQIEVLIIASPRAKYTETEFGHLRKFLQTGGRLLVLLGEGGERRSGTNVNFLLEEFGIAINSGELCSKLEFADLSISKSRFGGSNILLQVLSPQRSSDQWRSSKSRHQFDGEAIEGPGPTIRTKSRLEPTAI